MKTIATKVTTETLAALELMAMKRGTSVYDLVLSAIMMLLRLGSKQVALSDTVKRSWHAFEHEYGSLSTANLATLKQQDLTIQDAIYRVTQKDKKDATLMYMGRSFFSQSGRVVVNQEDIVAMVMRTAYPKTYQLLRNIQEEQRLPSVMGAISYLIDEYHTDMLDRQVEELFSDNARADNNRRMDEQRPYKRKHAKSVNQMEMNFDNDEQGQELPQTDREREMGSPFSEDEGI